MAKRRKSVKTVGQTRIVRVSAPRAAAPIIVRSAAPLAKRRSGGHRRHKVGGGSLNTKTLVGVAIGGAILGWVEKNYGTKLPTIPVLGVKGSIAIAAYFANKQGIAKDITRDVCIAAAATAAYQIGLQGKVSGEEGVYGDIVPQVGVAAQV